LELSHTQVAHTAAAAAVHLATVLVQRTKVLVVLVAVVMALTQ